MKKTSLTIILSVLLSYSNSFAYLYESPLRRVGRDYQDMLANKRTDDWASLPTSERKACEDRYKDILKDNLIDIRVAIGYFDWTMNPPQSIYDDGKSYGLSPSIDIGAFYALRSLLTSSCSGRQKFCGFKNDRNNPYLFTKDTVINGKRYPVRLEMHFSSSSEYLSNNMNSSRQDQRSQYTENFFLRSLQTADAVFYFGHARNGGGPDFDPPQFVGNSNKVNYDGYYKPQKPGLKKMISSLRSGNQAPIIGMMSCNARDKFLRPIRNAAPKSGVITSTAILDIDIVYTAMIGAIDSVIRGQCQKSFYESLRLTAKNRANMTMDGMFE